MHIKDILFNFQGRIRRSQWWLARLAVFGAVFVIGIVLTMVVTGIQAAAGDRNAGAWVFLPLIPLLPLLIWVDIATCVKRLHDQDMSGWFYLITFVPGIGPLFAFIVLGCLDSTKGPNKYGPSEKYPNDPAMAFS